MRAREALGQENQASGSKTKNRASVEACAANRQMFEPGGATAAFASTPAASLSASPEQKQCPPFADRQARSQPTRHASMTASDSPAPPRPTKGVSHNSTAKPEKTRTKQRR